eukprot:5768576-Amphidinium_carterae.2
MASVVAGLLSKRLTPMGASIGVSLVLSFHRQAPLVSMCVCVCDSWCGSSEVHRRSKVFSFAAKQAQAHGWAHVNVDY